MRGSVLSKDELARLALACDGIRSSVEDDQAILNWAESCRRQELLLQAVLAGRVRVIVQSDGGLCFQEVAR